MANLSIAREAIHICRSAGVSLFLWSTHGMGKSSLVSQVAAELGVPCVDFRCAQIESSDLRGLPDKTTDGRTHFLPPADLPREGHGILFLDELNRANPEVLSAAFQLVLDRRIGQYELPPGWSIVCAGNFDNGTYAVSELDPALLDRFCHIRITSGKQSFSEWSDWMSKRYPAHALDIVSFCGANLKHLEVVENEDFGFRIQPSRRSWELAVRCLAAWEQREYSKRSRQEVLAGLVGRELAIAFLKHRSPLAPPDVFKFGVAKLATSIRSLDRQQKTALMWGLTSHARDSMHEVKVGKVLVDFAELLFSEEKDLAVAFCTSLLGVAEIPEPLTHSEHLALLMNPRLAGAVSRVNADENGPPTFLDHLANRPQLAKAVARALSLNETCLEETRA